MNTVTLELPDDVVQVLSAMGKDVTQEVRLALAFNLCSRNVTVDTQQFPRSTIPANSRKP